MQYITKLKLAAMHQMCDLHDKSTEFMFQFMQDMCKVDLDTVMNYLQLPEEEITKLFKDVNNFTEMMTKFEEIGDLHF